MIAKKLFLCFFIILIHKKSSFLIGNNNNNILKKEMIEKKFITMKQKFSEKQIQAIDESIYHLLLKRQKITELKSPYKEGSRDPLQEIKILSELQKKEELDRNYVKDIWSLIFSQAGKTKTKL